VSFDCCQRRWGDIAPDGPGSACRGVTPSSPRPVWSLPSTDGRMGSHGAPLGGAQDVLRGDGDGQQVPVVDRAAVELLREHAEQIYPGELTGKRGRLPALHRDDPLDNLNCGPARGCSS
jgi:hypothetical protein